MSLEKMKINMDGLTVLITGGSNGIGFKISELFLANNAKVINWDIKKTQNIVNLIDKYEDKYLYESVDVSNEDTVRRAVENIPEKVDVLVNNAGVISKSLLEDIDFKKWDQIFNINVKGVALVTKYVLKKIKKSSHGRIINISSMTSKIGMETYSIYSSTKAAVSNLTKVWALELAKYNITVNAICPGWIDTEMREQLIVHIEIGRASCR